MKTYYINHVMKCTSSSVSLASEMEMVRDFRKEVKFSAICEAYLISKYHSSYRKSSIYLSLYNFAKVFPQKMDFIFKTSLIFGIAW